MDAARDYGLAFPVGAGRPAARVTDPALVLEELEITCWVLWRLMLNARRRGFIFANSGDYERIILRALLRIRRAGRKAPAPDVVDFTGVAV